MRKYDAAGSTAWNELEKADAARIVTALLDMPEFMVQMKSRTRYSPTDTPIKRLCCPKGHEIARLQAEVDIPMLTTGNHDEGAITLREPGEESDNYKPTDELTLQEYRDDWGVDRREQSGWYCIHGQDNNRRGACDVPTEFGQYYCPEHVAVGEPREWVNNAMEPKIRVRCPQPKCKYLGTYRRGQLLVLYAVAVIQKRPRIVLDS